MAERTDRLPLGERVATLAGLAHRPGAGLSPTAPRSAVPEECDVVVVGSGAAALSAMLCGAYKPKSGERVAVIVSGGNTTAVNFDR